MRSGFLLAAALCVSLLAGDAFALNAETDIEIGDKIYGRIETAGEFDRITFEAPRDAILKFTAKPRDEGLTLSLALYPPDAPGTPEPIDAYLTVTPTKSKIGNYPARVTGIWILEVRAGAGTLGRYKLKTKITYRRKWRYDGPIAASEEMPVPFAAAYGSRLKIKVKPRSEDTDLSVLSLQGPGDPVFLPPDLKQTDIPLNVTSEYAVMIRNDGAEGTVKATMKVKTTTPDPVKMYLSPSGYGPAPLVDSVDPRKALQGTLVDGIVIEGENFEPGAKVLLRRSGKPDIAATAVNRVSDTLLTCSLSLIDAKRGSWEIVVENPSGGDDETGFTVKDPSSVALPPGVRGGTEVWLLDFSEEFEIDLALFGLGGGPARVSTLAREAVISYTLYNLREIFGLRGTDGKVRTGAVPVSFVIDRPTSLIGPPGVTYNRLRFGGEIQPGDATSDNPNVAWGYAPLDIGNQKRDDLAREGGAGHGLFTRALGPNAANVTPAWTAAFLPMTTAPVGTADEKYFSVYFNPQTEAEGTRFRDIDLAVRTLSRELAAIAAHHIGRAMGLMNGTTGVSSTPALTGTFAATAPPEFVESEFTTLAASVRPTDLPGTSNKLTATYLPLRGLAPYLLPEVVTATTTTIELPWAGGRPDILPGDVAFSGEWGTIPLGFSFGDGVLSGTAPYVLGVGTWYYGIFRFGIRYEDTVTGDVDVPEHRINLTINLGLVPLGQQAQAQGINTQIRNTP
jgi:hypothetical protein